MIGFHVDQSNGAMWNLLEDQFGLQIKNGFVLASFELLISMESRRNIPNSNELKNLHIPACHIWFLLQPTKQYY
jgi:hypothetical protein